MYMKFNVSPRPSPIRYAFTPEAATHNSNLLASHDCDICNLIEAYPGSELSYGSDFRSPHLLESVFHLHPSWASMKDALLHGFSPSFRPIADPQRILDNAKAIQRGNHKSALLHLPMLRNQITEDALHGFQFPFLPSIINHIPHSVVSPYGIASNLTFDDLGNIIPKCRPTNDLSIDQSPHNSVNHRLLRDDLPPTYLWPLPPPHPTLHPRLAPLLPFSSHHNKQNRYQSCLPSLLHAR